MIKPLNNNILIKEIEEEKKTSSGIIVGTRKEDDIKKAKVIKAGFEINLEVYEDDVILYNRFSAIPVKYEDELYHLINIYDILAVIK